MRSRFKLLFILLLMVVLLSACNVSEKIIDPNHLILAYTEWDSEVASMSVLKLAMEDKGYTVEEIPLDNAFMWLAVANSDADAMVSAWLPGTHESQYENYGERMVNLGPNLKAAKIGLVVPEYFEVDSIADLTDEANKQIVAIEAGAGVVQAAEQALEDYDNLSDWEVVPSSTGAMVAELDKAISNNEDIIVTGWSPHWKFESYDLKYLDDPKGSFGGEEDITTFVRMDLESEKPEIYKIMDNFNWTIDDMQKVMADMAQGKTPEEAARAWIDNNQELVDSWFE